MKDFLGNELAVGDEVVFGYDNELDTGTLIGFSGFKDQILLIKTYENGTIERYNAIKIKGNQ